MENVSLKELFSVRGMELKTVLEKLVKIDSLSDF